MSVRAELHCHNLFSNFHVGEREPPYDCSVSVLGQLEQARLRGIDSVFVTNHNTLDGYAQMLQCKRDHAKFDRIMVYPAEEVTTESGAHILAYGIHEEIPPGLPLQEVLDEIRRQDAVSSAPHPFSLLDAVREDAVHCDMIEVFNSNNVDILSNARAAEFAQSHSMTGVAGSDSHVLSTVGRCTNMVSAQNNLDSMLGAMRRGDIAIEQSEYAGRVETMEHLKYKIQNSRQYIEEYISENYSGYGWLLRLLFRTYDWRPDSALWTLVYRLGVYLMGRVSAKVNVGGADPSFMKERDLASMLRMAM